MLSRFTATAAVAITTLLGAQSATAAPVDVAVRVEGVQRTVFDGIVRSDGRAVRAASDSEAHRCDGTNNGMHEQPGASATGATVDALEALGLDFDGDWYAGFDDYFVTRLGAERDSSTHWWGVLVNRRFTPVGGCQFQLAAGDDVLWVNDAFGGRPFLWLGAPDAGARPTVAVGQPLTVAVSATQSSTEQDETNGPPYAGATVTAVTATGAPAGVGVATAGLSGADGAATVTFHAAGWQRLKARTTSSDPVVGPPAIASNSVDVCVEQTTGAGCAGDPPSRWPINVAAPDPEPRPQQPQPGPAVPQPRPQQPEPPQQPQGGAVRVTQPRLVVGGSRDGSVAVSWTVARPGAGIRSWQLQAKPLGRAKAAFARLASGGADATSARVTLAPGATHALRLLVTDALGRTTTTAAGRVLVPLDDRARALRRSGVWTAAADAGAWHRTVSRGRSGATLRATLGAGRPVVLLRGGGAATVSLRSGGALRTVTLRRGSASATRTLLGRARSAAGPVELRVLRGTVSVDGVGLAP
ncbi:MAG TPA: hypothetical protein VLK58_28415 [Conexibacter sp.]|nr:hypothetical protein [Conexibacter sp.]